MEKKTLRDFEKDLISELNERKEEILSSEYPEDLISEIADSYVPIYNSDLLEMAVEDLWLAVDEPDVLAFDGKSTAVAAIAGNIYGYFNEKANEWLEQNRGGVENA